MATGEGLSEQFEEHRAHLRTVAYRMLGSASEAEDAVQETWIRLGRTDVGGIASLGRWLTTVVARVCLDMLRARTSRREDPLDVRRVVDAFLAAAREGNFEQLVALLDPDIVLRADGGALASASRIVRGATAVAGQAAAFSKVGLSDQIVLVNGNIGLLERRPDGRLFAVISFTIANGRIAEMNILADPDRLHALDLSLARK